MSLLRRLYVRSTLIQIEEGLLEFNATKDEAKSDKRDVVQVVMPSFVVDHIVTWPAPSAAVLSRFSMPLTSGPAVSASAATATAEAPRTCARSRILATVRMMPVSHRPGSQSAAVRSARFGWSDAPFDSDLHSEPVSSTPTELEDPFRLHPAWFTDLRIEWSQTGLAYTLPSCPLHATGLTVSVERLCTALSRLRQSDQILSILCASETDSKSTGELLATTKSAVCTTAVRVHNSDLLHFGASSPPLDAYFVTRDAAPQRSACVSYRVSECPAASSQVPAAGRSAACGTHPASSSAASPPAPSALRPDSTASARSQHRLYEYVPQKWLKRCGNFVRPLDCAIALTATPLQASLGLDIVVTPGSGTAPHSVVVHDIDSELLVTEKGIKRMYM
jgi:hypothetical protein